MATRTLRWFLAVALVGLALPASAVVVDDFSNNQATVSAPPTTATSVAAAAALGGRRGLQAKVLQGAGPVTGSVGGGTLNFAVTATTPDSRGEAVATWDGDSNANVLSFFGTPQNLQTGGHRSFRIRVNSAGAGTEILLEVYTDATNSSVAALRLPAVAAPTDFYLSYGPGADFVPRLGSGANFTTVGAIVMTVRGTETSAAIDIVETVAPNVAATKRDLELDNDPITTPQAPGTTYKYQVMVTNTGSEAVRVDFSDVNADPNITLDPATANASVLAVRDAYRTFGNIPITVTAVDNPTLYDCDPTNSVGLLSNDCDPDDNPAPGDSDLTITTVGLIPTTLGGSANVSDDGSFTYTPPIGVGFAVDTFSYMVQDDDGSPPMPAIVTINIGRRIWFVDDAHGGANNGTRDNPFVGFTATNVGGASGMGDQDQPEDLIFLYEGTHVSGLELEADQILWGHGEALVLDGMTIVTAGGTPIITSASNGIVLSTNNTIRALTVGNTTGVDVMGNNFGTLTATNVTLNGNGGALNLTNGALAATFNSIASTNATGRGINLDTVTGSLTVTGGTTITDSAQAGIRVTNGGSTYDFGATTLTSVNSGLDLTTNATSTFNFASLAVTTDAGAGLLANNSGTLNIGGAGNTIVATGGAGVDITSTSLGSGATFATVSSSGSGGKGINLDTVTGNFIANGGSITGAAGIDFDVNAGASTITYAGSITNTANRSVEVTGRTGGTVTLSGNISDTGTGVNVASNTGGTINFSGSSKVHNTGTNAAVTLATNTGATINFTSGGLDIDTTSGAGFNATGGGTLTVQGSTNTINSTTGTALNVVSSTIGAAGLTFRSIASNGAINGIVLNNTGANAGLTVTGTGSDDSGGTIASSTQDGILLVSTRSISLTEMAINSSGQSHIDATTVNGLTLANVDTDTSTAAGLLGNGITSLAISGGVFHRGGAGAEPTCNIHGVDITNLLGTSSVSGLTLTRSNTIQFRVRNTSASVAAPGTPTDVLTVSGTTWGNHTGPCSGDHLSVTSDTGGNFKLIANSSAGENNFTTGGIGIQVAGSGSGTAQASITGVDSSGNTAGVAIAASATSNVAFNVFDNRTALGTGFSGTGSVALILTCTTTGVCQGAFNNNTINHTAGTATNAMQVVVEGDGTGRVTVANNVVSGNFQRGLQGQSRAGSGSLSLLVNNNNFTQTDVAGLQVMNFEVGASGGGTTNSLCLNLASNTATPVGGNSAYRLFHRTGYTYQLQNLVPASTTNPADVQNWVTTTKSNIGTPVSVTVGTSPFTSVAACATPTLPSP